MRPSPPETAPSIPSPDSGPKIWTAGTLVYTRRALLVLFAFLLIGDFAWSMRERSVGPMAQWYLKQLEVSNLLFGLMITSLPAVIGLIVTPIISYRSDRHRGPRGRRIPFLMATTPVAAFGMAGIALSPIIGPWLHEALGANSPGYHLVSVLCFGFFWTVFDFAQSASYAVFHALINDVVPRPFLGRFYGLFRMVSLLDGIIFNYWLFGKVETHFTVLLLAITGVYAIGLTWVCFKVKEGTYPPPPPPDPHRVNPVSGFFRAVRTYARECFTNRFYLVVFFAMTIANLSVLPINTFSLPYAQSLGLNMDFYGKLFAITFVCSIVLAYPMGWLADAFHPLRVAIVAQIGYAAVSLWGALYADTAATFTWVFVAQGVLAGCYNTGGGLLIGLRLFPRLKYAQFASAAALFFAFATMLIAPVVGQVIDFTGNTYRHAFSAGFLVSASAVVLLLLAHRGFERHGGIKNYRAPLDEDDS